jgi:tetratricopeptide (TPR) repeat protein
VALVVMSASGVARAQHDARAVELFKQSAERYREGRFREAADLLREAYAREPEPLLLFNLGRACEGMGDAPCAIDAYTRFLAAKAPSDRGAIESRIATLKRQLEEKQRLEERAAHATVIAVSPAPPARPRPPSPLPWIVAGAGVVGLGVGAGLGATALHEHQQAVADPVQKTKLETQASAKSLASATNAVLIASALVTAGGVTWGAIDLLTRSKPQAPASGRAVDLKLALSPTGASLFGHF